MRFDVVLHPDANHTNGNALRPHRMWSHPNRELQLARITAIMSRDPDVWVEFDGFTPWMQPDSKLPCVVVLCTPNEFPSEKKDEP